MGINWLKGEDCDVTLGQGWLRRGCCCVGKVIDVAGDEGIVGLGLG